MDQSSSGALQSAPPDEGYISSVKALKDRLSKGERWQVEIKLAGTQMEGLNLARIWAKEADFRGARLRRANLRSAMILKADFEGADLRGANLCGATFNDASFHKADLRGANLSGTEVDCANFRGALYDDSTRWPKDIDPEHEGALIFRQRIRMEDDDPERNTSTHPWFGVQEEECTLVLGSVPFDS